MTAGFTRLISEDTYQLPTVQLPISIWELDSWELEVARFTYPASLHNPAVVLLQAWRTWRGGAGVGLLATAALAAGIGSATAIYSIVNAVMLKPLPYPDSERFVAILGGATNDPTHDSSLTYDDAQAYQDRTQAFDLFGWFRESSQNVTVEGEPHHVEGVRITDRFVHGLGVNPMLGQWFRNETEVVISNAFWRRLGSDAAMVGKPITMDGRSYTIAGVMPPAFRLPVAGLSSAGAQTDVWLQLGRENVGAFYFAYARRRPGVSFAAAEADAKRVAAEIAAANPSEREAYTAHVYDLRETVVKQIRPTLLLLFAAAALLFLITCANAAGLLLARSVARARETAMRVALGASRRQLATQYSLECLPIALAGALGGIVLSTTLTPVIVRMAADYIPRAEDVALDWTVLAFAMVAAFVATVISSLAPLWQAAKTAPADVLGEGARGSAGTRSRRASQSIVVAEIALAFVLLASSGLLLMHLRSLSRTAAGFDTSNLLTFVVSASAASVAAEGRTAFQGRVIEALARVPGIDEVGFANQLPLDGCCLTANIYPDGRPVDTSEAQRTSLMAVSSGFVKALRLPLRSGRLLREDELPKDLVFVMVNEAAVRRYWNGQDPIGRFGTFMRPGGSRFQVIGVVGDVKNDGLGKPPIPEVYISSRVPRIETMHMAVRSSRDLSALVPEIRRAVRAIDPEQPVHSMATMDDIIQRSLTLERAASFLTGFFAVVALLIATLGVYGVVAYLVRQRTVEIGTRMAIGASRRDVVMLVIRGGLKMAVVGVLVGAAAAFVAVMYLGRVLQTEDIGVTPFIYSTMVIGAVTLLASSLPAWRASLLSPMVAIRDQPGSMWEAARSKVRRTIQSLSDGDESAADTLGGLILEFAGAVQGAGSVHESVRAAIAKLQERAGAESAILLERRGDGALASEACTIPAEGFLHNRLRSYRRALAIAPADFSVATLGGGVQTETRERDRNSRSDAGAAGRASADEGRDRRYSAARRAGRTRRYPAAEREALSAAADVLALILENARLTERELEQERVRRDLALAAEVQKRLLPSRAPEWGGVSIAGYSIPARVVGGDYFDFLERADGQIGIAIADVAGKGIAAALLMSLQASCCA